MTHSACTIPGRKPHRVRRMFSQKCRPRPTWRNTPSGGRRKAKRMRMMSKIISPNDQWRKITCSAAKSSFPRSAVEVRGEALSSAYRVKLMLLVTTVLPVLGSLSTVCRRRLPAPRDSIVILAVRSPLMTRAQRTDRLIRLPDCLPERVEGWPEGPV